MKAQQTILSKTWQAKPLTVEQRNAIDLLIIGKSDQQTADVVGVARQTVQIWRTGHLVFQSELERARGNLFRESAERLRGLMAEAIRNIAGAIEEGDVKASFELLKAIGLYGHPDINSIKDWRLPILIRKAAEEQTSAEGVPQYGLETILDELSTNHNPVWRARVEALEAELRHEYGAGDP